MSETSTAKQIATEIVCVVGIYIAYRTVEFSVKKLRVKRAQNQLVRIERKALN